MAKAVGQHAHTQTIARRIDERYRRIALRIRLFEQPLCAGTKGVAATASSNKYLPIIKQPHAKQQHKHGDTTVKYMEKLTHYTFGQMIHKHIQRQHQRRICVIARLEENGRLASSQR